MIDTSFPKTSEGMNGLQKNSFAAKFSQISARDPIDQLITIPSGSYSSRTYGSSTSKNATGFDLGKGKTYATTLISPKGLGNGTQQLFMKRMNGQTTQAKKSDNSTDNTSGIKSIDTKNTSIENEEYFLKKNMKIRLVSHSRLNSSKDAISPDREENVLTARSNQYLLPQEVLQNGSLMRNNLTTLETSAGKIHDFSDIGSPAKPPVNKIIKSTLQNEFKKNPDPNPQLKDSFKGEFSQEPFDSKLGNYSASKTKNDLLLSRIASTGIYKSKKLINDLESKDRNSMGHNIGSPTSERLGLFNVNLGNLVTPKTLPKSESYGFPRSDKNILKGKRLETEPALASARNVDYASSFDKQHINSFKSFESQRKAQSPTDLESKLVTKPQTKLATNTKTTLEKPITTQSYSNKNTLKVKKTQENVFPLKIQKSKSGIEGNAMEEKVLKDLLTTLETPHTLSSDKPVISPRNKRVLSPPSHSVGQAQEFQANFSTEPDEREYIPIQDLIDKKIFPLTSKHHDYKKIDFDLENLDKLRPPGLFNKNNGNLSADRKLYINPVVEFLRPTKTPSIKSDGLPTQELEEKLTAMERKKQDLIDDYQKLDEIRKSLEGSKKIFEAEETKEEKPVEQIDQAKQEYIAGLENSLKQLYTRVKNVLGEYKQSKEDWATEKRQMQEKIDQLQSRVSELEAHTNG